MKKILLTTLVLFALFPARAQKGSLSEKWSDVYSMEIKGLALEAHRLVNSIHEIASRNHDDPNMIKALIYQAKYSMIFEENSELLIVNRFKKDLEQAKFPYRNILQTMLASLYEDRLSTHSWLLITAKSKKVPDPDFRTWDNQTLQETIDSLYREAMRDEDELKKEPISRFESLLVLAHDSDVYCPTLFDFIANKWLAFLRSYEGRSFLAYPTITIDTLMFRRDWASSSTDLKSESPILVLFKKLEVFHRQRHDTAAFVRLVIDRTEFLAPHIDAVHGSTAL